MIDVSVQHAAPDPSVGDLLAAWLPTQRWFPGGASVQAEPWLAVTFDQEEVDLAPPEGAHGDVVLLLTRLRGPELPGGEVVAQVPLVLSDPEDVSLGHIGTVETATGEVAVHDGGANPACWVALLRAMGVAGDPTTLTERGRVLAGEQSNTSVILPGVPSPSGAGGMLKILRTIADGPHPDVVVPQALTADGWEGVPRFLGALEIDTDDGAVHLAILSELVPHAEDGFEMACDVASRGEPFVEQADALGRLVAELHQRMATLLPTGPPLDAARFVAGLRRRADRAVAEAEVLAPRAAEVTGLLDDLERRLAALPEPVTTQRIHGDLHLGQTLFSEGWKVLDFEGEPQRSVDERTAPDLPLRDVAGMLRSFDYAAAVGEAPEPASWQAEAADAFLAGYRKTVVDHAGMDEDTAAVVLDALVLDKALYEVVYESHHRPTWLPIPLGAVDRLLRD
ncbi:MULTISPECIES: phosphotransferase [unclassified Isoptericola]|uniref:phosphotransferase n=1 Tax=unclassified Isoptericola TaxID=2623355 RepID=UPI00271397BC|nr:MULTISPECIES: phosphotransferase [unclassified Isoptericola]MDO8143004.1 phosphotransferase [Isoptericola sp. 178]MDO8146865.1 phosphotransferase [Isoptericola sp. b515]MDO8150820.1 phosphotransferase [Isoptericola sp. b408]